MNYRIEIVDKDGLGCVWNILKPLAIESFNHSVFNEAYNTQIVINEIEDDLKNEKAF